MNRIDALFAEARKNQQTVFIPFLTAGDPNLAATVTLAQRIFQVAAEVGVPLLLELGFPYSDPIADGATIQTSYTRALAHGIKVAEIFAAAKSLRAGTETPIVAMVSYSLVFRKGPMEFLAQAREAGFDGAIVPDLPVEEAAELHALANGMDFKLIQLVAPTTPPERALEILRTTTGFVYCVSVTGITGERKELPPELSERISWLRENTRLPVAVGFGVSRPEQVKSLARDADGVIVGSAIVGKLANLTGKADEINGIAKFVGTLLEPLSSR